MTYMLFLLIIRPLPRSTLFPYTTLFRSRVVDPHDVRVGEGGQHLALGGATRVGRPAGVLDHHRLVQFLVVRPVRDRLPAVRPDRKSTRLNSSHVSISYAVFCLKKKRKDL